ncbi:hypothetical protein N9N71_02630 [Synechococcus sp. AH-229-G18]|nr:hypothetical protein [Synechococcus sp. AH-229-G18]
MDELLLEVSALSAFVEAAFFWDVSPPRPDPDDAAKPMSIDSIAIPLLCIAWMVLARCWRGILMTC